MEPIIQDHLRAATTYVAERRANAFNNFARAMVINSARVQAVVQSPLETLFLLWWSAVTEAQPQYAEYGLEPQAEVRVGEKLYRVDFLVVPPEDFHGSKIALWQPIAVEVDGHGFHERTREQVQLRDSRDRALVAAGWRVFHFSFSEFTGAPAKCVEEVLAFAWEQARIAGGGRAR